MKKVLATILAMAMILSLGVISFAAEPQWTGDTDGTVTPDDGTNAKSIQENGSASTWFKVLDKSDTIPTYWMSVSVPLGVTFCISADGTTSVPTTYKVENYSPKAANVSKMNVVLEEGWSFVESAAAAASTEDPKALYFTIKEQALRAGTIDSLGWCAPAFNVASQGVGTLDLPLTARAGKRDTAIAQTAEKAFTVTYTVALAE